MIGVIVISHGILAQELVKSAQMLVGEGVQMGFDGIMPEDSSDLFFERVSNLADELDTGSGLVALVDLYGGTPCNTAFRISSAHTMRIITGANLPMVMAAISDREEETTLEDFVAFAVSIGSSGVSEFPAASQNTAVAGGN